MNPLNLILNVKYKIRSKLWMLPEPLFISLFLHDVNDLTRNIDFFHDIPGQLVGNHFLACSNGVFFEATAGTDTTPLVFPVDLEPKSRSHRPSWPLHRAWPAALKYRFRVSVHFPQLFAVICGETERAE